jgi:histidine triad (HIT) family protein
MCVFCKIVNGEIPCFKIHETENTLAFLDISQNTIGHTLVIPKRHVENIFNLDEELSKELFASVTKTAKLLKDKLGFDAANLLNNNGEKAGQVVNHYHIHIIPRYGNDECYFKESPHDADFEKLGLLHKKITE